MDIIWKRTKTVLLDTIEAIDMLTTMLGFVENEYGHNVKAMRIYDNEELAKLTINTDSVYTQLGNLRDIIVQHIKEEDEYWKEDAQA